MSQTPKKSGGRDISDLKARLGLNKGGPGASKPAGGVVPPPGVRGTKSAGAVPAPPGAKQPAPAAPPPSDDPFAAMNAMAAVGTAQKAAAGPEFIVVNDGGPVESVDTKSRAITIGKYAGMILMPFIIGIAIGQMSYAAKVVNLSIRDAAVLRDDVMRVRTHFNDNVMNELLRARERGRDGNSFKLNDEELTAALAKEESLPVIDPGIAFHSHMYELEPATVESILQFYTTAGEINALVKDHAQIAKQDAKAMKEGNEARAKANPSEEENRYAQFYRYAMFIEVPTKADMEKGKLPGARLVEVGQPVCQDKKPSTTGKCQGPPMGFTYRLGGAGVGWTSMELGSLDPATETVPSKKLLPLVPTQAFEDLIKGGQASTAEVSYMRRVDAIYTKLDELIKSGVELEKKLDTKAREGKSFTFFL